MRPTPTLAAIAVLALAWGSPVLAQRGRSGGDRGPGQQPDAGAGRAQPRDSSTVVNRALNGGRVASPATGTGVPTLSGLGSASLIAPRAGVDLFQANGRTYGGRPGGIIVPRGPSWGGVPVSSVPSWGGTPIYGVRPGKRDGNRDHRGPSRGSWRRSGGDYTGGYGVVYGLPYGYVPYDVAQPVVSEPGLATPAEEKNPEGFLRLLVTPRDGDVIVDGVFVGSVDDFGGTREQTLPAGLHHIRIEAAGYEQVEFDVRVPAGDTITLRREMTPLPAPPRAEQPVAPEPGTPGAPATRKTFYAIPRCYLGDTIPRAESLAPGCSLGDLRVLPAQ